MRMTTIVLASMLLDTLPLVSARASDPPRAAEWPSLRGPNSDGSAPAGAAFRGPDGAGLAVAWRSAIGPGYAAVAVARPVKRMVR